MQGDVGSQAAVQLAQRVPQVPSDVSAGSNVDVFAKASISSPASLNFDTMVLGAWNPLCRNSPQPCPAPVFPMLVTAVVLPDVEMVQEERVYSSWLSLGPIPIAIFTLEVITNLLTCLALALKLETQRVPRAQGARFQEVPRNWC